MSRYGLVLIGLGLMGACLEPAPAGAAVEEPASVEKVEYQGWKNNLRVANGTVELVLTLDVGPRIIRYGFVGGKNVLKEYPEQLGKTGEKEWKIRGGHRLWLAPEDVKRTYSPDNGPVEHRMLGERSVRLTQAPEPAYGIQREIDVTLAASGSQVTLIHRIKNVGTAPTELAPWALTVMAPGGTEIIPLPAKRAHPEALLPNQTLVLWPYFDFKDPRWSFGSKYITLKQDAGRGPTKAGLAHQSGWVGYWNGGTLFVKRLPYQAGKTYPDQGCNFETFTNQDMLEVETLGPLVKLAPGEQVEHREEWELHREVAAPTDEAAIDKAILARVRK
jgi:hypothetical protein